MFNKQSISRNYFMLKGKLKNKGYDWWWHSFSAIEEETGKTVPFFIEFFCINPGLGNANVQYGDVTKKIRPSYLMIKAGCWGEHPCQLHRFIPWSNVNITNQESFQIEGQDCFCSEHSLKGAIDVPREMAQKKENMCDSGTIDFDLTVSKEIAFNVGYGASKFLRDVHAFEMYWHVQGMKSSFQGTIHLNGKKYLVEKEKSYGYQDKNWGSDFTSPWVWLSSNHLIDMNTKEELKNSAFDIGGGRPKVFFIPLNRKLLGALYLEGQEYEFNFSKFWTHTKTSFSFQEEKDILRWKVIQENRHFKMETTITSPKERMLFVHYQNPLGDEPHKSLWNGGEGQGTITLYKKFKHKETVLRALEVKNAGVEYGEYEKRK